MAALVAAVLLSSLDGMIFNTALPTIVGQLHGIARMSWVPTAYLLTTVITMPVYGKLGDLPAASGCSSRHWHYSCPAASSAGWPAPCRCSSPRAPCRALAAAASWCCRRRSSPTSCRRGSGAATWPSTGSVFIFSSVAGPLLGGWFTTTIGWRWAFWMNVPVAVLAIAAAIALLPASPDTARPRVAEIGLAPIPLRLLASRKFVLATIGALCGAVAMFGAAGYLPDLPADGRRPHPVDSRAAHGADGGSASGPPASLPATS